MLPNLFGSRAFGIAYLLRALFNVGDTGAIANATVLDTPAEGVTNGTETVVATAGQVEILNNKLRVTGSAAWGTSGIYSNSFTRALGQIYKCTVNIATMGTGTLVGLVDSADVAAASFKHSIDFTSAGIFYWDGTTSTQIGPALTVGTDYEVVILPGGYSSAAVPFKEGDTAANFLYGAKLLIRGGTEYPTNFHLLWSDPTVNTATLYAAFTTYDATASDVDSRKVPDAVNTTPHEPTVLDLLDDTDTTLLTDHTADVGGSWADVTAATTEILSNRASAVSTAVATQCAIDSGISDVRVAGIMRLLSNPSGNNQSGVCVRVVSDTNKWYFRISPSVSLFELVEVDAGSTTVRASIAFTPSVSTNYALASYLLGNVLTGYIEGAYRITYTSALHNTATKHGTHLFAANSGSPTLDNFEVLPLTDATQYDDIFNGV